VLLLTQPAVDGKLRHEVAYLAGMPWNKGHHLLFCQQYPTRTCVTGNGGVRKLLGPCSLIPHGRVTKSGEAVTTASIQAVRN